MRKSSNRKIAAFLAAIAALALVVTACSSDDEGDDAAADNEGTTVAVTLQEFAVVPESTTASAGEVTFDVTNEGPEDVHEFVVFETDLAPDALPTLDNGAADEEGEGLVLVGEVEDVPVGGSGTLTEILDPGSYVLVCNIYDESEDEAHYQEGMFVGFTVE